MKEYKLGNHLLIEADVLDLDLDKLGKIDMLFTDPPYDINSNIYSWNKIQNNDKWSKLAEQGKITKREYKAKYENTFNQDFINIIENVKAKEKFVCGADYFLPYFKKRDYGLYVWDKRSSENREKQDKASKMFGSHFELIYSFKKHKREIIRDVIWCGFFGTETEHDRKRCHPMQKPRLLAEWFIKRYTKENDVVLDLFGGSGATLLACENTGRKCIIVEKDKKYIDLIQKRYETFTDRKKK